LITKNLNEQIEHIPTGKLLFRKANSAQQVNGQGEATTDRSYPPD